MEKEGWVWEDFVRFYHTYAQPVKMEKCFFFALAFLKDFSQLISTYFPSLFFHSSSRFSLHGNQTEMCAAGTEINNFIFGP